jgi:hypothetical protein
MRRLSPAQRRAVLTVHIASSVGLLGASSSLLALAVTGATTDDPQLSRSAFHLAENSGLLFGIPLSFSALISGLTLALGSAWGILRHRWVTAKLVLLVLSILMGALVIGSSAHELAADPAGGATTLIAGASVNVMALLTSTILSVYKPGRRRRARPA